MIRNEFLIHMHEIFSLWKILYYDSILLMGRMAPVDRNAPPALASVSVANDDRWDSIGFQCKQYSFGYRPIIQFSTMIVKHKGRRLREWSASLGSECYCGGHDLQR
jgi:hypothetical protein